MKIIIIKKCVWLVLLLSNFCFIGKWSIRKKCRDFLFYNHFSYLFYLLKIINIHNKKRPFKENKLDIKTKHYKIQYNYRKLFSSKDFTTLSSSSNFQTNNKKYFYFFIFKNYFKIKLSNVFLNSPKTNHFYIIKQIQQHQLQSNTKYTLNIFIYRQICTQNYFLH